MESTLTSSAAAHAEPAAVAAASVLSSSPTSAWVDCLVSIRFDLDIGPKIETVVPPDAITEEGKMKLLHCAFPDCNPDCGYNFIFYFTMPDCTTAAAQSFSQTVAPPTTANTMPELYGAAFYRQKHDPNVPRRYVQQVVVLLSHLPYYNVHELILRVVAPRFCQCCPLSPDTGKVPISSVLSPVPDTYFEVDQSYTSEHYTQAQVLADTVAELAMWPSPHPQVRYSVTLLQQALIFVTPAHSQRQLSRATRSSGASGRGAMSVDDRVEFMETARGGAAARYRGSTLGNDALPLFSLLGEQLHHLTYAWELLIRHEPLFILSNTPCMASAAAFSIASLVLPIEFNGTLRSYFTVQNEDFSRLSRMGKVLAFPHSEGIVVAGTNPFLLRSFSGWPSLMVVMDRNTTANGSIASPTASANGRGGHTSPPPPPSASASASAATLSRPRTAALGCSAALPAAASMPRVVLLEELRATTPPQPSAATASAQHGAHGRTLPGPLAPLSTAPHSTSSTASHGSGAAAATARYGMTLTAPVTVVPRSPSSPSGRCGSFNGSGVHLAADMGVRKLPVSPSTSYMTDPHATYDLESSSASSTSRSTPSHCDSCPSARHAAPTPPPPSQAAHKGAADDDNSSMLASTTGTSSLPSPSASGLRATDGPTPANRLDPALRERADSTDNCITAAVRPASTPLTISPPTASGVNLFTAEHYKTTVESVRAADHRKRGGAHQDTARGSLQQRLHNYFDSSVHFLLNHEEQTKLLLKRLEMVSLLDADAQRTSVSLSLTRWHGIPRNASSPTTGANGSASFASAATSSFASAGRQQAPTPSQQQQQPQHHADPAAVTSDITSCSRFSVADDMVRKFFTSLTSEFLTPVAVWYQRVTAPYTAFHLCDRALCEALLSPASFLDDFAHRHRETAPTMWTQLHSYKTYKTVYERFANGCLFKAYVRQLVEESLRRQMDDFQVDEWVSRVPSETERIDLLINLLGTIQRELSESVDPDVLFVTSATAVLASMAVVLQQPHREQFMLKIGELRL